jgi:hypothetical protein
MKEQNFRDSHHVLWQRNHWSTSPEAKAMRQTHSLIPKMDRQWHEAIHGELPPVPVLGTYALRRTLMGFEPTNDTLRDMDGLALAMDKATKNSHTLGRELAGLAIENLMAQKPMVADGIVGKPRLVVVNNFEGGTA